MSLIRLIKIIRERKITDAELFSKSDKSGDGVIDLTELKECLETFEGFTEKELNSIMMYMDIDGDGSIDKIEFLASMKKAHKIYDDYQ